MEVLLFNLSLNLPSPALQEPETRALAPILSMTSALTSYTRRFNSKAHFDIDFSFTANVLAGFTVNECRQNCYGYTLDAVRI
jgi:hypothetical protein